MKQIKSLTLFSTILLCLPLPYSVANAKNTVHITTSDGNTFSSELISKSVLVKDSSGKTITLSFDKINKISVVSEKNNSVSKHPLLKKLNIEMLAVPAGEFIMGDINLSGYDNEKPVHKVNLNAFLMQKTELTNAQYLVYLKEKNYQIPESITSGPPDAPVTGVGWTDARRYSQWLSHKTGLLFKLPSEAQWEYAARAGSMSDYSWGNTIGTSNAVCDGCGSQWDSVSPAPVGSFPGNAYGLKDMHGNVWEWVADCWHDNYDGAPNDGSVWDDSKCRKKVLRGGSWTNEKENLRVSTRFRGFSIKKDQDIGFRLVQILPKKK